MSKVDTKILAAQARDLALEIEWFRSVFDRRLSTYFQDAGEPGNIRDLEPPDLKASDSNWARFIQENELQWEERLAIVLAFMPHLQPQALDLFFTKNSLYDRPFTEFGGVSSSQHKGFLPSGETLLFLLSGSNMEERLAAMKLLHPDHKLLRRDIVQLQAASPGEPESCGALTLAPEFIAAQTHGVPIRPVLGQRFPAERIDTRLEWADLVLHPKTSDEVAEIQAWMQHEEALLNDWQMASKIRPGLRVLFHGPPGTGKTMTACLLGKHTGREVYRIDLSMVVSKYIGETEKNLNRVFQQAENKNWILFFDEADALFGKRTETKSAHDRYANQEVAYLLQRIEHFNGVSILATNFKNNMDKAFVRRFEFYIHFPMPGAPERLHLWQNAFSPKAKMEKGVDLEEVAEKYELSGGAIMNIVRHVSLKALQTNKGKISPEMVEAGIRREVTKEGRVI